MRIIRRLFTLFWTGLVLAMVLGAVGALAARRRIVPVPATDTDEIELRAIFEPMHFQSRATSFRGGSIECWYGGGVIDLRDAVLDPAGARLDVRAIFGGAQLLVPESWTVTSTVKGIGGVGDARPPAERPADAPHLAVDGYVLFGGYAIMSEVPEDELRGLDEQISRWARHGYASAPVDPASDPAS
ncbi:MAG: hypothetical protein ACXW4H_05895 [Candidatus Limnocylindrales bacterium]